MGAVTTPTIPADVSLIEAQIRRKLPAVSVYLSDGDDLLGPCTEQWRIDFD